jgi:hypothetical protein
MTGLLPEPVFLPGMLLKIAMTAGIVVAASVVERSGPFAECCGLTRSV